MDKKFKPKKIEKDIYSFWEKEKLFEAKVRKDRKPFSIILPPPNANADLHIGHAMYVYEDIMIRYHKLLGFETLWLPGADHAGFETQYVFEKELKKKGRTRFDYDRKTLFTMIWEFVMKNRGNMENQLRRLGFALDWSKKKFTMDPDIVEIVYRTFKKLFDSGLVYRAKRLVNYCTSCGTSFSDLEVVYKERVSPLYFIRYGPFAVATTRPETKFGDTAVAVNPKDKRYREWIGKKIRVKGLINDFEIKVVGDKIVDPEFGTGVVKVTPAHDFTDFEIGQRHGLEIKQVIGFDGKLNQKAEKFAGLSINEARKRVVKELEKKGLLVKIKKNYKHRVGTCYKCATVIEPLPLEQWFIKIKPLADRAKELVDKGRIKIFPQRFKKILIQWLNNFKDWNISRQTVWGIRIPAYKCLGQSQSKDIKAKNPDEEKWFVSINKPNQCPICGGCNFKQDSDTFDTWFSSAQWPYATLLSESRTSNRQFSLSKKGAKRKLFDYFYPTSVMETGYDILPWWVARMIMIGYFMTGKEPFKTVFLHGLVRDKKGQKMSKSKGNVINPMEMVDKYGADALRGALLFGVKEGGDVSFSEERVVSMRNFANKVWNIGRFIFLNSKAKEEKIKPHRQGKWEIITNLQKEFNQERKKYFNHMKNYRFSKAFDLIYHFLWHRLADYYIEELKEELRNDNINPLKVIKEVYFGNLKMLHPFMPFVTEAVWQIFKGDKRSMLREKWQAEAEKRIGY